MSRPNHRTPAAHDRQSERQGVQCTLKCLTARGIGVTLHLSASNRRVRNETAATSRGGRAIRASCVLLKIGIRVEEVVMVRELSEVGTSTSLPPAYLRSVTLQ